MQFCFYERREGGGGGGLLGAISRLELGSMLHNKNQTVDCEISLLDCVLAFLTPHSRVCSPSISLLLDLPLNRPYIKIRSCMYFAPRLRGIEQKKSHRGSGKNILFLLP